MVNTLSLDEYVEFNVLILQSVVNGQLVNTLISSRVPTVEKMRQNLIRIATKANPDEYKSEVYSKLDGWRMFGRGHFGHQVNCMNIKFDPLGETAEFNTIDNPSTDIHSYGNALDTTSEILEFMTALSRATGGFLMINNIFAPDSDNYSYVKLLCYFVDNHSVQWDNLRVDRNDPEMWDFEYDKIDVELARYAPDK